MSMWDDIHKESFKTQKPQQSYSTTCNIQVPCTLTLKLIIETSDITKNLLVLSILAPETEIPSEGGDSSKCDVKSLSEEL